MADPTSEAGRGALKLDFDRSLVLQFRGSAITSDAGLLPYRELDDALSLTDTGADVLSDTRTGRNGRRRLAGLLRRSVFGRLAGYEDVNDAHRVCRLCQPETSAARRSNGSKRARARSNGRGCHAVPSRPVPSAFSFMCLLTTSVISCERWRCPRRRSRGH